MTIYVVCLLISAAILLILLFPIRYKKRFCLLVSVVFCAASMMLYHHFGTAEILPMLEQREERMVVLKEKIIAASEAIKKEHGDVEAWLVLADSFMETSQFSAASNAYKQAVLLSEGNPIIIMAYARSLVVGANGVVGDDAKKSLDMVRMLQPDNGEARYYLAVHKLQAGQHKEAMEEMKSLYQSLPEESPLKNMIDRQIGRK